MLQPQEPTFVQVRNERIVCCVVLLFDVFMYIYSDVLCMWVYCKRGTKAAILLLEQMKIEKASQK